MRGQKITKPCENCGIEVTRYLSQIYNERTFCSYECCNYKKNNPAWKGGVSSEDKLFRRSQEYKDWRFSVFKRDLFKCCRCGEASNGLEAHHRRSFARFPELRLDLNNGITLCKECHKDFHSLYGLKSFTSDDLYEWMKG